MLTFTHKLCRPTDCHLSMILVPTFADRGCHVVSVTNPYSRNLGFLDRSHYFLFQIAPPLYSRGWVDPVLRKYCSTGNRTRTSESVARNSDHQTTESVNFYTLKVLILFPLSSRSLLRHVSILLVCCLEHHLKEISSCFMKKYDTGLCTRAKS
jgi:hypothetical protein